MNPTSPPPPPPTPGFVSLQLRCSLFSLPSQNAGFGTNKILYLSYYSAHPELERVREAKGTITTWIQLLKCIVSHQYLKLWSKFCTTLSSVRHQNFAHICVENMPQSVTGPIFFLQCWLHSFKSFCNAEHTWYSWDRRWIHARWRQLSSNTMETLYNEIR